MPKRIERLTKKQEKKMSSYAQHWIDIGLKTGEADWDTFDKYMPICYEKAGLKYPKNIVHVQSPLVGGLAAAVAEGIWQKSRGAVDDAVDGAVDGAVGGAVHGAVDDAVDGAVDGAVGGAVGGAIDGAVHGAVRGAVRGAVGDAVHDAVDGAVDGAVGGAVDGAVRGAVHGAVRGAVRGAVGDAVHDAVHDAVDGAVHGAVRDAVDGAVRGAVGGAVGGAVDGAVGDAVDTAIKIAKKVGSKIIFHWWIGGQFWVGGWYWGTAFVNFFFDICKLKLSKDIMERALAYRKVCESVNYIWPNRDFVIVCDRPKSINRDENGRLHNPNGKSIEYKDGWGLYHIHGVKFTEEQHTKAKTVSVKDLMSWPDIEQRSALLRDRNLEEMLKEANAKIIDQTDELGGYKLWEIDLGLRSKAKAMTYGGWSDGRPYAKFVPPDSTNCLETIAKLREMSVDEFKSAIKS